MTIASGRHQELVESVISMVWDSLLQAEAVPWTGQHPHEDTCMRAEIVLTGDWSGAIRLTCHQEAAQRMAGSMLHLSGDDHLPQEQVDDAIGEVVNVVGGNVKGALGGRTALGLPTILHGTPDLAAVPSSRHVVDWDGWPVVLEVFASRTEKQHPTTHETGGAR
jgi:chemotaxis protein CheX